MTTEVEIVDGQVIVNNKPSFFQIVVGNTGSSVEIKAKSSLSDTFVKLIDPINEDSWIISNDLPYVDIEFTVPVGCKVYRVYKD